MFNILRREKITMNSSYPPREDLLEEINNEQFTLLIPVVVYLAVLGVSGLVGNLLVLVFYGCKSDQTAANTFILALCISDLIVCCIGIPIELTDVRLYYLFNSAIACKLLRYITHFAAFNSCVVLLAIAVHRHRKICNPLKSHLTRRRAIIICIISVLFSGIVSTPAAVVYTNVSINVTNEYYHDLTGKDCTTESTSSVDVVLTIFTGFQLVVGASIFVALIVLYSIVGRKLYLHQKHLQQNDESPMRNKYKNKRTSRENDISVTEVSQQTIVDSDPEVEPFPSNPSEIQLQFTGSPNGSFSTKDDSGHRAAKYESPSTSKTGTGTPRPHHINSQTKQFTVLMFTISGVFFLSFVPYVILVAWRLFDQQFKYSDTVWTNLLLRSYFLNSCLNPFIYGFFNSKFRQFVRRVACSPCRVICPCVNK